MSAVWRLKVRWQMEQTMRGPTSCLKIAFSGYPASLLLWRGVITRPEVCRDADVAATGVNKLTSC
jgi:hypothetical protein